MDKLFYAEETVIPTTTRYNQAMQKSISECKTSNLWAVQLQQQKTTVEENPSNWC